jgi:topoisomerase-4 subunit B
VSPQGQIELLIGLDVIRRRPSMYIGDETPEMSLCTRLVELVVMDVVTDVPSPTAARLILWDGGVFTVAFDGVPIPIRPLAVPSDGVPHPELYRFFLYLTHAQRTLAAGATVLNALSERLVVSTMHDGHRYEAMFARGAIVQLLARTPCDAPLGTNWLTFRPDPSIITGDLDVEAAEPIVERAARDAVRVELVDRTSEKADWLR